MAIEYVRCKECSCVYTSNLEMCPRCGEKQPIQESSVQKEPVFNILD